MRGKFKAHRQKSGLQEVQTVSESGICSPTLMQMRTIGSPRSVPLSSYSNLAIKDTLRFIASRVSKVVQSSMSDVELESKLPTRKTKSSSAFKRIDGAGGKRHKHDGRATHDVCEGRHLANHRGCFSIQSRAGQGFDYGSWFFSETWQCLSDMPSFPNLYYLFHHNFPKSSA